jgi:hypothetical protein
MTASGAAFLGGARSRLLPASLPLRFFASAAAFHLLGWLALAAGDAEWPSFAGGLGWPLAALHLFTLGVLGMTALGAGAQLLPVATRQPAPGHRVLALVWWIYTPGVLVVALGMGLVRPDWLAAGGAAVALSLAAWAVLMLRNLRGARGMPGIVAHGWAALVSLAIVLASALSLSAMWLGLPAPSRAAALALHVVFAPLGFMGLLALGLSYILVPMFALADAPPEREQLASAWFAMLALVLAAAAVTGIGAFLLRVAALAAAAVAVSLHLRLMRDALRSGLRRELGRSFLLVKIGWAGLVATLAAALALALELPVPRIEAWFGLALIGGWLLSFLLGMLQRILPFLAAMHAAGASRRAPTPSSLTDDRALALHLRCHVAALAGLALALVFDSGLLTLLSALVGAVGAAAFCWFVLIALRRLGARRA